MKVLFIGGNGNISWWCVQKAIEAGHTVYELNRGATRNTRRPVQAGLTQLLADIQNAESAAQALKGESFDVVCDFICYSGRQAKQVIDLFSGRAKQYIVISSEAVYKRDSRALPFRETAEKYSPDILDRYIAGKLQVEEMFRNAYEKEGFPSTIVRPGYTYDTIIPVPIGQNCFTAPQKFLSGYPLLMPGDGENLWSPLHSSDFAEAFVQLIGNTNAIGDHYHITGETLLTWNELAEQVLCSIGAGNMDILHIPRENALKITSFHSEVVMRQHMWHYIFDNAKIKKAAPGWRQRIPFNEGICSTVKWLYESDAHRRINAAHDEELEKLYKIYWRK